MRKSWNRCRATGALLVTTLTLALAAPGGASIAPAPPPNDEAPPVLTLDVSPAVLVEGKEGVLGGSLGHPYGRDLRVTLRFGGDAGPDDFRVDDQELHFPAGETYAKTSVRALNDPEVEKVELLVVSIDEGIVALADKAIVEITDPDSATGASVGGGRDVCIEMPKVWLESSSKLVAEGGAAATLTLNLSGPACGDLSFPVELDRIPVPADVVLSAWSFDVPAGALSSEITIAASDDAEDEAEESVTVRVQSVVGNDEVIAATFGILDNDADISLEGLSGPERVVAGERGQFEIVVTNPGHKELTQVAVVESPVEGMTDVEWLCFGKGGAECPEKGQGFVSLEASMPSGSALVIVVDARIDPARREALVHQASIAVVDGALSDPDPSDNVALAVHPVDVVADLELELSVGPWDPKSETPTLTYSMLVRNAGPSDASGAVLTSPLSEHLSWAGGDEGCVAVDAAVTCDVATLRAGESRQVEMALSVARPYPAYTTQEAWLDPTDPDPYPGNDEVALETKLDLFSPVLEQVVAVGATGQESLGQCSQLIEAPLRLRARFSEPLAAGGEPGDVDSPRSYRLYGPGANGRFEISDCGEIAAEIESDDVEIALGEAIWDESTATVDLEVRSTIDRQLAGSHRLIACESLRDLGDNGLDGDADGNPGDAAVRGFRIDAGNLVRNGHFDCALDGWSALAPAPEDWTLGPDASGSPISLASRIDNAAAWPSVGVGTCVATEGATLLELALRHRLSPVKPEEAEASGVEPLVDASVTVSCTPYPSVDCSDALDRGDGARPLVRRTTPTGTEWVSFFGKAEMPAGYGSLLCTVSAAGEYTPFALEVDEVRLRAVEWGPTGLEAGEIGGGSASAD